MEKGNNWFRYRTGELRDRLQVVIEKCKLVQNKKIKNVISCKNLIIKTVNPALIFFELDGKI